jgi:hypothetical protein
LVMQGAWSSQHHHSWECVNSQYEEHCPGPVHMWRPNTDGTKRFMTRTDMLANRTMCLIGRIPLDMEHLLLWKLHYRLKQIPRPPSVHGCINDCLYLRATPPHKCQCDLRTSDDPCDDPCDEIAQQRIEAEKANDEMAQRVESLLTEHHWLSWGTDGSPIFKIEKAKLKDGSELVVLADAPETKWTWKAARPKLSVWSAKTWNNDPLIQLNYEVDTQAIEEDQYRGSFGHWSANGSFRLEREWVDYGEDEGLGRGPDDKFQEEMAEVIVKNRRALVIGRGGTGKSHLIGLLRPKFKALGYKVICIVFTHVAVANVNDVEYPAYTILHLLHRFVGNKRNK